MEIDSVSVEDRSVIKQIIKEMKGEKEEKELILKEWLPFHGSAALFTSDQQPLPVTKVPSSCTFFSII
jgi:hypothetical protein